MESHWHYKIMGAEAMDEAGQQFKGVCYIVVIADNEKEAYLKAANAIKKNVYQAIEANECVETHGLVADIQVLDLELRKKQLDAMRNGKN